LLFPFIPGKSTVDIKDTVLKGEAIIAVEKIKTQVAYERLISVIEKSIE
jgi:hypothetical protein